jgi:hypothetical protein
MNINTRTGKRRQSYIPGQPCSKGVVEDMPEGIIDEVDD